MNSFPQRAEGSLLLDNIQISKQLENDEKFEKQANRLKDCGKYHNIFMCGCGFRRISKKCNYRICPVCGKIRSIKFYKKFIGFLKGRRIARSIYDKGLRLFTLTIKNQENLEGGINKLYAFFTKFKRRDYRKMKINGGLGVIDIKKGKDGLWNHHIHFIIDSSFLDMKSQKKTGKDSKLVSEWKLCTGGSGILDIKRVRNHSGSLNYVLKYLTKGFSELTVEEKAIFFKTTFKRRLLFTFGDFYKIKYTKKKWVCPHCGYSYQYLPPYSEEHEIAEKYLSTKKPPPKDLDDWFRIWNGLD